ncbi:MAG TPA: hypothetical protein VIY86_00690, partial [Pirellulaceae bacterium]
RRLPQGTARLTPALPRRGVLLLVVLSLLVLFVLAGLTFMVVASQYRRTTIPFKQHELSGDDPAWLCDTAVRQLLRGPKQDERSVIKGHSLLDDLYGNDGERLIVERYEVPPSTPLNPTSSPFPTPHAGTPATPNFLQFATFSVTRPGSPPTTNWRGDGHYIGSVVTLDGGSLTNATMRVVGFQLDPPGNLNSPRALVTVEVPESVDITAFATLDRALSNGINVTAVFNGRPFNGTGAGLDSIATSPRPTAFPNPTHNLDVAWTLPDPNGNPFVMPLALIPNLTQDPPGVFPVTGPIAPYHPEPFQGGADESYDAVDYQNMYLAWVTPGAFLSSQIIPSFHRPEILSYFIGQAKNAQVGFSLSKIGPANIAERQILRRILLRPNWLDHPLFSG